jgi:phage-related protein
VCGLLWWGAVSWIGRAIGYVVDVFAAAWPFILDGLTQFADSFAGVWSSKCGWGGPGWV